MSQHIFKSNICRILFATCLSALCLAALSAEAATITVMNSTDSGPGSLRQALADAVDGDTINFDSSLNGQRITLTSGDLLVNKNVTIRGPGANSLAVDANHASRVFYIASGKNATISGLTVTNGSAPFPDYRGSGSYNDHATLTVSSCTISGNSVNWGAGGGIYNDGYPGGAMLTITNSTISGNSTIPGAGVYNWVGTVTITNSALSGNSAGLDGGGGIRNHGTLTIANSTLSGNSSLGSEGGIENWSATTLTITNSTLSGNFCGNSPYNYGGGIYSGGNNGNAILKIGDTIFNAGPVGDNIYNVYGTVISLGYNLSSDNGGDCLTATGDRINTDPKLGPLQNNGGSTFTHLPASQ